MKQQHRLSKKQRHVLKLLAERPRHRLEPEMWGWVAVEDLRDLFLGERPDGRYSSAEMLSAVRSARRSVAALAEQGLVIVEARYFGWDPAKEEGSGAQTVVRSVLSWPKDDPYRQWDPQHHLRTAVKLASR